MNHALPIVLLAAALAVAPTAAAQEPMPPPTERGADDVNEELAEARRALADAARRVAELSANEADRFMRNIDIHRVEMPPVRLGIAVGEATAEGVTVGEVAADGPAASAGLRTGDVLVEVNGASMAAAEDSSEAPVRRVQRALLRASPGDVVKVRYRRGRRAHEADVTLEAAPERHAFAYRFGEGLERLVELPRAPLIPHFDGFTFRHGFGSYELVNVSPDLGRYFNAERGLLVVKVGDDNPLTLRDGDVILSLDGRQPESPTHAARILRSYQAGETVRIELMRDRRRETIEVTIPERTRTATTAPAVG